MEKIDIKIDVPIVHLPKVQYTYSKVKKPSLVKYMLLVFLSNGQNDELIVESLNLAGVEGDLIDIFIDALWDLIEDGTCECLENFGRDYYDFQKYFYRLKIDDIELTPEGQSLFNDGYVNEGEMRIDRRDVFYDPIKKMFSLSGWNLEEGDGCLQEDDRWTDIHPSKVFEFLTSNKKAIDLGEKDHIVRIEEITDKIVKYKKYQLQMSITRDGIEYLCDDADVMSFFTQTYTPEQIQEITEKVIGKLQNNKIVEATQWDDLGDYADLFVAREVAKEFGKKVQYRLCNSTLNAMSKKAQRDLDPADSSRIFQRLGERCDALALLNQSEAYIYYVKTVKIPRNGRNGVGNITLDLLVKQRFEKVEDLINELIRYEFSQEISEKTIKQLQWLEGGSPDLKNWRQLVKCAMLNCDSIPAKLDKYKWLDKTCHDIDLWKKELRDTVREEIFNDIILNVTTDNLDIKVGFAVKWRDVCGKEMSDITIYKKLIDNLPEYYDIDVVVMRLEKAEISEPLILSIVSPISYYLDVILGNGDFSTWTSNLSRPFYRFAECFKFLKNQIGMSDDDPRFWDQTKKPDYYEFKSSISFFVEHYSDIQEYQDYSPSKFETLESFYKTIIEYNSKYNEKLAREYSAKDFRLVADKEPKMFCYDFITRAQIELEKLYGDCSSSKDENVLYVLINRAVADNYFTKEGAEIIHEIRKKRNKKSHEDWAVGNLPLIERAIKELFQIVETNKSNENRIKRNHYDRQKTGAPKQFVSTMEDSGRVNSSEAAHQHLQYQSIDAPSSIQASRDRNDRHAINTLFYEKKWDEISEFLKSNLNKSQVETILQDVLKAIENCVSAYSYWEIVRFLLQYDAHTFLATITKANVSKLELSSEPVDRDLFEDIVEYSFGATSKLKHSLDIIKPCKGQITLGQKNYILSKCGEINDPELFYKLFEITGLDSDSAVVYLLSLKDNPAAAYTLYKIFADAKKGERLGEESGFACFRPSKIEEYVEIMRKLESYPFYVSARLICASILGIGNCPSNLVQKVREKGYSGFDSYCQRQSKNNRRRIKKNNQSEMVF